MKKTLVALAVAATAATAVSTANAAVVYEQDGAKVEVSGSFRAFLGRESRYARTDLLNDDSRILINASQNLGSGLSAFVGYELRFDNNENEYASTFGNPTTRDLFAGFKYDDVGSLSFGRQLSNADDVLQDNGYYNSGEFNPLTTHLDKSIKFRSAEWNGFSFGLDYGFGNSNKDRDSNALANISSPDDLLQYKNSYGATLFYNYDIAEGHKLDLAAAYTQDNFDSVVSTSTLLKQKAWLLHAGYTIDAFNLGVNYGQVRHVVEGVSGSNKGTYSLVQASYQVIEPSRIYSQWERLQAKDVDGDKQTTNKYLVGVDYKLHKNVVTYVQYAHKRVKDKDSDTHKDNEYGVGLRVFF